MRFRTARDRVIDRLLRTRLGRKAAYRAVGAEGGLALKTLDDHVILASPADNIGREIHERGHFERDKFATAVGHLRHHRSTGGLFLEVGANIGSQTIYAALTGLFPRQIAIEPTPQTFAVLKANIALNGLSNRVEALAYAIGAKPGTASIRNIFGNCGAATLREPHDERYDAPIEVEVTTLDHIVAERNIAPSDISLIWMDIEGFEPQAWEGMSTLVEARVPICMEFSPLFYGKAQTEAFVASIFKAYGEVFQLDASKVSKVSPEHLLSVPTQVDIIMI